MVRGWEGRVSFWFDHPEHFFRNRLICNSQILVINKQKIQQRQQHQHQKQQVDTIVNYGEIALSLPLEQFKPCMSSRARLLTSLIFLIAGSKAVRDVVQKEKAEKKVIFSTVMTSSMLRQRSTPKRAEKSTETKASTKAKAKTPDYGRP